MQASDKSCWTEPPGWRWNGQCAFQRRAWAIPTCCATSCESHAGRCDTAQDVLRRTGPCLRSTRPSTALFPARSDSGLRTQRGIACGVRMPVRIRRPSAYGAGEGCKGRSVGGRLLQYAPAPDLAVRAARDLDGGHASHEGLGVLARLRVRCWRRQHLPSPRQPLGLGRQGQQPVVKSGGNTCCSSRPMNR